MHDYIFRTELQKMKTLIVEDDPVTRRLLEEILEPYADFISLGNGKDALEALHCLGEP